jgi:cytochrome c oxidase assembly protein subunit 15
MPRREPGKSHAPRRADVLRQGCYWFMMTETQNRSDRLARFVLLTLAANLLVILWGAWVRASGSGAGCGNHWPTCGGTVIPQSPTAHTLIEFTHRASSGLALVLVLAALVWSFRRFGRGHWARRGAVAAMVLMCVEAALGAGLVKFALVAEDASLARALSLGAHLVNTQLLLAAIALTGWWAAGGSPPAPRQIGRARGWLLLAMLGLLAVGMTGAIASLGDTLFPARTLVEGIAQDFSGSAHLLLRLRKWHPVLAVLVGTGVLVIALSAPRWRDTPAVRRASRAATWMVLIQWTVGLTSLILLAPVVLQLLHLLSADLLWLATVWLAAELVAGQPGRTTSASSLAASRSNTPPAPASR